MSRRRQLPYATRPLRVAIIGAGFSGIGAAIQCAQAGIDDVVVLEAGDDVGGTWRENTYPGAACDVPSRLYSLSFAPRTDWTRVYATQSEIQDYLAGVVDRAGLRHVLRTGTRVVAARYDDPSARWHLTIDHGETVVADAVINAVGALRVPAYARVAGRERFAGPQLHTARWDEAVEVAGRRVGVVGTGASAIQLVPALAATAGHVKLFQRTPPWVMPRRDRPITPAGRTAARYVPGWREAARAGVYLRNEAQFVGFRPSGPGARLAERIASRHLRTQVTDPRLRARLTPDYAIGCKRVLLSDDFYPALQRDDVSLVVDPICRVVPEGVVTSDGRVIELDVLVHATGFSRRDLLAPMTVTGRDGRRLDHEWQERPTAYLGISAPGFPNFFTLLGPNTGLGHNSVVVMIEAQLDHVVGALRTLGQPDVRTIEVRPEVSDAFVAEVDARHAGMVWASGCASWYLDDRGRNVALWPGSSIGYRLRTRRFDPGDHHVLGSGPAST